MTSRDFVRIPTRNTVAITVSTTVTAITIRTTHLATTTSTRPIPETVASHYMSTERSPRTSTPTAAPEIPIGM
jgi:hypothetical protein